MGERNRCEKRNLGHRGRGQRFEGYWHAEWSVTVGALMVL